jgi:hypothetical protein
MVKLVILVLIEIVIGMAGAALLLAVIVPLLIGHHVFSPGDLGSSVVISAALLLAIGAALLRPNSALRRFGKRGE